MTLIGLLSLVAAGVLAYAAIENYQIVCLLKGQLVKRDQGSC